MPNFCGQATYTTICQVNNFTLNKHLVPEYLAKDSDTSELLIIVLLKQTEKSIYLKLEYIHQKSRTDMFNFGNT